MGMSVMVVSAEVMFMMLLVRAPRPRLMAQIFYERSIVAQGAFNLERGVGDMVFFE